MKAPNIKEMPLEEKAMFLSSFSFPCPYTNIGDLTLVVHGSCQSKGLEEMLQSVIPFVKEIVYIDDNSIDNSVEIATKYGCKIIHLPEGWIYTHGFSKLIGLGRSFCKTEFFLQVDTDEKLYIPEDHSLLTGVFNSVEVVTTLETGKAKTEINPLRLIKTEGGPPIKGLIHQGLDDISLIRPTNILIYHTPIKYREEGSYYELRKERLYIKLLQKACQLGQVGNKWWLDYWEKNKIEMLSRLVALEQKIGLLEETEDTWKRGVGW